ncbi:hypothetical protein AB4Z52_31410 [Rhizobium sp. 2YAF20]|uniref:hypothetical protein n=1 Tax=Rhizobium sp. 2YAF20 TaxID=3233027 RepID=UPI003F9A00A7
MSEANLIDDALSLGLARELLGMMEGESEYSDIDSILKLDRHSGRLLNMATRHIDFMLEFGCDVKEHKTAKKEGKVYSSYPEYFEAWKLAGIPGISLSQLTTMIEDKSSKHISWGGRLVDE